MTYHMQEKKINNPVGGGGGGAGMCQKTSETFLKNRTLKRFGHCLRREHNHIDLCGIAETGSFWEKEQRSTEKEMDN